MKKIINLCVLALVAALLFCVNAQLTRQNAPDAASPSTPSLISDKAAEDVVGLSWSRGTIHYAFEKQNGTWVNLVDMELPVNQQALAAMAEQLVSLPARQTFENVASLADYGIHDRSFTVHVTYADGAACDYIMGAVTPFQDGVYLHLSTEENTVHVTPTPLNSIFSAVMTDLTAWDALPDFAAADCITLDSLTVQKTPSGWTTPDGAVLDSAQMESYLAAASSLAWTEMYTVRADAKTLDLLSLNGEKAHVLTLSQNGETLCTLYFGATDSASALTYCRVEGSPMVYLADAHLCKTLTDFIAASPAPDAV